MAASSPNPAEPEGGGPDDARPWHPVPRLDAPARLLLGLPGPQARWLLGGVLPALIVAGVWAGAWSDARWWMLLVAGIVGGAVGAFLRPHGRHLGQWLGAWLTHYTSPRRAVWRPVGRRTLVW